MKKKQFKAIAYSLLLLLCLVLGKTTQAQVITESFEESAFTVGSSTAYAAVAGGATAPTTAASNSSWTVGGSFSVTNGTVSNLSAIRGTKTAFLAASVNGLVITPFFSGGVTVVTVAVNPTTSTSRFLIGAATATGTSGVMTSTYNSLASAADLTYGAGVTTLQFATGIWINSGYSVGVNMTSGSWNTLTFTTNIPASKNACIKFQRFGSGNMYIDDINVFGAPSFISITNSSASVCTGTSSQSFVATFRGMPPTNSAAYTSFQWQRSPDGSTWTPITIGISGNNYLDTVQTDSTSTLTIHNITDTLTRNKFRCVALGTTNSGTATLTVNSNTAITAQPQATASYNLNATPTNLSVTATGANLTYQWYSNTAASTTSPTPTNLGAARGAQTSTYTPLTTSYGTLYYYCVVTGTCGLPATSSFAAVNICSAPTFSTQPVAQSECVGGSSTLTAAASLSPTWQWYSSLTNTNSGGISLGSANGAQTDTYTPPSGSTSSLYYYVEASNGSCVATSNAVLFTVSSSFSINTQPSTSTVYYTKGASATSLSVSATGVGLTYQWYKNAANANTGGSSIGGATSNTYTPSTAVSDTFYYYCIVSSPCASPQTSNVSGAIKVVPYADNDLVSAKNTGWGTASSWLRWRTNTTPPAFVAGAVPGTGDNVWIMKSTDTVTISSASSCKDLHVLNGKLLVAGIVGTDANLVNKTGSATTLTINGTLVEVTGGAVGYTASSNPDSANALSMAIINTTGTTITGTGGTIDLSKLTLTADNAKLIVDRDLTVHYHGSSNNGSGYAFGVTGSATSPLTNTITINAGKTVTFAKLAGFYLGSSNTGQYQVNLTLNVDGTLQFTRGKTPLGYANVGGTPNGIFVLSTLPGYRTNINVHNGGKINVTDFFPSGYPASSEYSNIVIDAGGEINVDSIADFRNPTQIVTGGGTFRMNSSTAPVLRIGSPDGISATGSTGPIQTTTRIFPSTAIYNYQDTTTTAQFTGDGLPSTVAGLNVNNRSVSLSLTNNVTVNDSIALRSGLLNLNGKVLALSSTCNIAYLTGNDTSYVNGAVVRNLATTTPTTFTFPTGKSNKYSPVTLNVTQNTATATTYTAEAYVGSGVTPNQTALPNMPDTLTKVSATRYYNLSSSASNIDSAFITLNYSAADTTGSISIKTLNNIKIAKYNGSNWVNIGPVAAVSGGTVTSTTPFNSLGNFVLANADAKLTPPSLTADPSATVDNDITMAVSRADSAWRANITSITYGVNTLYQGIDYEFSSDSLSLILHPAGNIISGLRVAGTKLLTIASTGYDNVVDSQKIAAGTAASLVVVQHATATGVVGASLTTQPKLVFKDQYGNPTLTGTDSVTAAVTVGAWTLGGTLKVSPSNVDDTVRYAGLTATEIAPVTGAVITFTSGSFSATDTFNITGPSTYYWVGGTTSATMVTAGVWSKSSGGAAIASAITPSSYDTYIFDGDHVNSLSGVQRGSVTISLPSTYSTNATALNIGKVVLLNSATVTFNATGTRYINIGNAAYSSNTNVFDIPGGSTFSFTGSTDTIRLQTNSSAIIGGTLNLGSGGNTELLPATSGSTITFNRDAICNSTQNNAATMPFGQTGTNVVVFNSGSTFTNSAGGDVFGGGSVASFAHGSTYIYNSSNTAGLLLNGHTFGNVTTNTNCSPAAGASGFSIDTIRVTGGTFTIAATSNSNNIYGDIYLSNAGIFKYSPASGGTLNLVGSSAQAITATGTASTNFTSAFASLNVNNSNGVTLGTNLSLGGTLNLQSGTFTVGADSLTLNNPISGTVANLIAGNTSIISIAGTTSGINVPSNVTSLNKLYVTNTSGTTLQGDLTVSNLLSLTAGNFVVGSNTLTLTGAGLTIGSGSPNYQVTITGNTIKGVTVNTLTNGASSSHKLGFTVSGTFSSFDNSVVTTWPLIKASSIATSLLTTSNTTLDASGIVTPSGLNGGNFSLSFTSGATLGNPDTVYLLFTPATTITVSGSTSYTYSGAAQGPSGSTTQSTGTKSYSYTGVSGTTYGPSATKPTYVGSYQVVASVTASGAWISASSAPFNFTINQKALTVTAVTSTKTYDGTTSSSASPTVGSLVGTDVVNASAIQVYDNKNYGTSHVLIPSGLTIKNGSTDVTANYNITYTNSAASGVINKYALTVTAVTDSKVYDGTTSSDAIPSVTGTIQTGDVVNFIESFDNKNLGTNKTLTPSGIVTDGNSGNNYSYTFVADHTGGIYANAFTWVGTTNNWNLGSNWSGGSVPTTSSDVTIPSGLATYPSLSAAAYAHNLFNESGATISLNGQTLSIYGLITGTGTIKGSSTSGLVMSSNSANTINFSTSASTDTLLGSLTLNGTGTVTLGTGIGITHLLSLGNASAVLNLNSKHLTLKSTSIANTAEVGVVTSGASITGGNVTVERFIPDLNRTNGSLGLRTYRDLCASVANAGSVFSNWQENGVSGSYGIFITGKVGNGVDATTGIDMTSTGSPSMYSFNGSAWSAILNTKTTNLDPFQGYRALVRGDRNFSLQVQYGLMKNPVTLRTTGSLVTGNVTYATTGTSSASGVSSNYGLTSGADAYSLIANPYACPIDWSKVTKTNVTSSYYYLDPTFLQGGYSTYITVNSSGVTNLGLDLTKLNIQAGQGFYVQNASSGTPQLVIHESDKAVGGTHTNVFGTTKPNLLAVTLLKKINGTDAVIDGTVAVFDRNYTKAIGEEDSKKITNGGENISIIESTTDLSIDGLPIPVDGDIISLRMTQMVSDSLYQLKIDASNFDGAGVQAFIRDNYLKTEVPVTTTITFTPTTNTSTYRDRFSIVFKNAVLSVRFTTVKAAQLEQNINVNWATANESNIARYEVEKSVNGKEFSKVNAQVAKNIETTSYNWLDQQTVNGSNYYRIKVIENDGKTSYSNVVVVNMDKNVKESISVYPNPVTDKVFTLQMLNITKGKYNVSLINSLGQEVMTTTINHEAGSSSETIRMNSVLPSGVYTMVVKSTDGKGVYQNELLAK